MSQASTSSANPTVWDAQQCPETDNKTDNTITLVVAPWETQALQSSNWSAPRGVGLWGLTRSLEKASLNCVYTFWNHLRGSQHCCYAKTPGVSAHTAVFGAWPDFMIKVFSSYLEDIFLKQCYWMLLISMKTFQKCSTDSTTSLVAGLCMRLPKLQVCELSDLNQIDLCSPVHWCGDISMAEAKSFWSLCLLGCFRKCA